MKFLQNMSIRHTIFILVMVMAITLMGQTAEKGKIFGSVVDSETGQPIIGANVYLENTSLGAASDLDGRFIILNVPVSSYTLIVSVVGYAETRINGVEVKNDDITKLDIMVQPEILTTDVVVVEAKALRNTEASLLKARQKSLAVSDAISAEGISRSGSGDAADAMKKVTGASVVDNKYVFIRGLGERYTITQLNGAELPSSDPDKKAFQFDIIPTNLLDNIVTTKTFTPDKPGNFSGGAVNIGTKTFPDYLMIKFSAGTEYNTQTTFSPDFITYDGGKNDWLGFDDGTRAIPVLLRDAEFIPVTQEARFDSEKAEMLDAYSKSFNNIMDFKTIEGPVNSNIAMSIGNRVNFSNQSYLGYMGSMTYSRSHSFYKDGEIGRYVLASGHNEMTPLLLLNDSKSSSEANMGFLADLTYFFNNNQKIGFNAFYSHNGTSITRYQNGQWPQELGLDDPYRTYQTRVFTFLERDVRLYQLKGEHYFRPLLNLSVDWSASLARSTQDEPDRRAISLIYTASPTDTSYTIRGSNFPDPSRYYRYLKDNTDTYIVNFSLPFSLWSGRSNTFKFGYSYQDVTRDFRERIFSYSTVNNILNEVNGDLREFFGSAYSGITRIDTLSSGRLRYNFGNTIYDFSKPKNNYDGYQLIRAYYGMVDLSLLRNLRLIGGARYETTLINVESQDPTQLKTAIEEKDWLPSLGLIYQVSHDMNLRASASRTLARPNFRELAPYSTKDFSNDVELLGNPELKRTLILNYDLRWEWFYNPGKILSLSTFYKELKNPIEIAFSQYSTRSNPIVTYTNVERATIKGVEMEGRIGLGDFVNVLSPFSMGGNFTVLDSDVDIAGSELNSRLAIDSTASRTRSLQGQSNYILNLDFSYENSQWGTVVALNYNYFGKRLAKVSALITPDVFELPATQLNLIITQNISKYFSLKLSAKNLLNSPYLEEYEFEGEDYIFQKYTQGRSFGIGINYQL